jgi:hypothetical protein
MRHPVVAHREVSALLDVILRPGAVGTSGLTR